MSRFIKYINVEEYLAKRGYTLPDYYVMDVMGPLLERILFPHGCLLFSKDQNIDQLLVANDEGFPYAVSVICYYFAEDTEEDVFNFKRPYQAIFIGGVKYTQISPELIDRLKSFKQATLERHEVTKQDPRLTCVIFNIDTIFTDMLNNQKPDNL